MAEHYDLLIRNGTCVLPWGQEVTNVGVRAGRIVALGVPATASATILESWSSSPARSARRASAGWGRRRPIPCSRR